MKDASIFLVIIFFASFSYSQTFEKQKYRKAKLYLNSHLIVKVRDMEVNSLELSYKNAANNKREKNALSNIKLIRVPNGSHLLEGALIGAGTMALTAVLIDVQPDPLGLDQKYDAGFYIGLTAGGAALGALVGVLFPKWKTVYTGGKFIGKTAPVKFDFSTQHNKFNLTLSITL